MTIWTKSWGHQIKMRPILLLLDSWFLDHPKCDYQATSILLPAEIHLAILLLKWAAGLHFRTCWDLELATSKAAVGQKLASCELRGWPMADILCYLFNSHSWPPSPLLCPVIESRPPDPCFPGFPAGGGGHTIAMTRHKENCGGNAGIIQQEIFCSV